MLTGSQRALIKKLRTRQGRKKSPYCLCEGLRCCRELIDAQPDLIELVVCEKGVEFTVPEGEVITVSSPEFRKIAGTVNSQGILCVARRPSLLDVNTPVSGSFVLLLENIADPGNMGTIIRTAKASGLTEISCTNGSVDIFSEKVIRSATAAQFSLGLRCFENTALALQLLGTMGYGSVYRTDPHEGESCFKCEELFDRSVIVIGNEANGVSELPQALNVTIPMPGKLESLNAAQAATILLFEHVRRTDQG